MFSKPTSLTTAGIRVTVGTAYIPEQSDPVSNRYVFAYKITIINESRYKVQLLRRKWFITDAVGKKRIVEGDGVIGQQPIIKPGESHQYISGCDFNVPLGKMEGEYFMKRLDDNSSFSVLVPSFMMVAPVILN